jgi:hypothetical protein
VILAGLEVDAVAAAHDVDGPAAALQTPTLRDPDRLAEPVCVPGDPGAPGEVESACSRAGAGAAAIWSM